MSNNGKLTARLTVRLEPLELAALERVAADAGVTPSEMVRELVRDRLRWMPFSPRPARAVEGAGASS